MVICLAVGGKSDTRQGRTKCLRISKGRKSETTTALKIKCRNIQSIQQARINHAYCVGLNCGWKKMRFYLALNKVFCLNSQPHRQVNQRQRRKINKAMLSALSLLPHRFSTPSELKSK